MKIRRSIRLYFFATVILLALLIITAFSFLTLHYFIGGMSAVAKNTMLQMSEAKGVRDGHPVEVGGFYIASRWDDLPSRIHQVFSYPPKEPYILKKEIRGKSIFHKPKEGYFVIQSINTHNEQRYVAKMLIGDFPYRNFGAPPNPVLVIIFGISGIVIFSLLLVLIMRKVSIPVEKLRDWARELNEKNIELARPNFRFQELNTLADIIRNSLRSMQESLKREQDFLSYASHELRTPIATIQANTELLEKINQNEGTSEKQRKVIQRINRAGTTMAHLTETLLWLSRDEGVPPEFQKIPLDNLINTLVNELNYLLHGKYVDVTVNTRPYTLETTESGCRIVLTNLIRNAFQHTQEGQVIITQIEDTVTIRNIYTDNKETDTPYTDELGFGLGLQLTEKLIHQFEWKYNHTVIQNEYYVEIKLT